MSAAVKLVPVVQEIPADLETPVSAYLKLAPSSIYLSKVYGLRAGDTMERRAKYLGLKGLLF